uniref:SLC3A2_N domain-containing protein n=1 Tax=Haemonchus contortus TaxID=6289 RepID=A0A7I4Y187_HAECO
MSERMKTRSLSLLTPHEGRDVACSRQQVGLLRGEPVQWLLTYSILLCADSDHRSIYLLIYIPLVACVCLFVCMYVCQSEVPEWVVPRAKHLILASRPDREKVSQGKDWVSKQDEETLWAELSQKGRYFSDVFITQFN